MKSNYKRLGDYIRLVNERNTNSSVDNLLGVSIQKNFITSIANTAGTDMKKYRVVKKNQFAYSPVTSRNGDKLTIALLKEHEIAIISPAYTVFECIDHKKLLPDFLFIWCQRSEFDHYTRFHSWGSARETFTWDDMCEVRMPIPDIDLQRKYVDLYSSLLENQKCQEKSLSDLQLICDSYLEALKETEGLKTLGEYIEQSDKRNDDLKINNLLGISVNKKFIPSRSNKEKLSLKGYKMVSKGQLSYVTVTSRNGEKISIALQDGETGLVSSTYIVFQVRPEIKLLPEFLFLWCKRSDFDRYARFNSWGSARETFDWEEMCRVQLPIPDIKIQESIVAIHHVLEKRKRMNEQLKTMISKLCPVLMSGVVREI